MTAAQGNSAMLVSLPRAVLNRLAGTHDLTVHVDRDISLESNGAKMRLPSFKAHGKFIVRKGSSRITPIGTEAAQPSEADAHAFACALGTQPSDPSTRRSSAKSTDVSTPSTSSPSATTPEYSSDDRDKEHLEPGPPGPPRKKARLSVSSNSSAGSFVNHAPHRLTLPSSVAIAGPADWAKYASMFHQVHDKYTQLHERLVQERSALENEKPASLTQHDLVLLCNRLARMEGFLVAVREAMVQYKTNGRKSVVKCDAPVY